MPFEIAFTGFFLSLFHFSVPNYVVRVELYCRIGLG